ncbi:uncharacterized protein LOC126902737 isoform X2 [Daktulosphaira vitifoliae]|uniref:uncharacterized protein LOC126902737 isoform X2 n=1 Tax=Daktulosphaira vitifoliae TaxID=58002 RepID=UPI0021AAD55C|nr:uncharacterized protein LOC126902737 isoform X2 [Daktulosphaira vitifoliae]
MEIFYSIKLYVLIFSLLMYIQIVNSTKDKVKFLFENDGWKNLTEVEYIMYNNNKYTLQQTLQTPVTSNSCNTRIRSATIILGCSYANVLKTIFFIMDRFLEYCETLISSENENKYAYDCTIELINTMPNLSYLATLMKGALVSIDKLHRRPVVNNKRNELILNNVTTKLRIKETLNVLSPLQINPLNTKNIIKIMKNYFIDIKLYIEDDLKFCHLKSINLNSLWQILNKKYQFSNEKNSNQEFRTFISHKIKSLIHWTIIARYTNLGFKFDSSIKKTILLDTSKKNEAGNCYERKYSSIKINNLFKHSGWKNINDVNYVTYSKCNHTLQDIIQNTYKYDKQIRIMTLILGCSYTNILKNFLFMLLHFQDHCKYFSNQENLNDYAYNCTIELLKTIPYLTSMVIYMGSAIDALDKTQKLPIGNNNLNKFILDNIKLIKELQNEEMLNLLPLLQMNQSNINETLLKILSFINKWNDELNKSMSICNINFETFTLFWQSFNNEYHKMQLDGFIFNTITNETLIPALLEPSENENIAANASTQTLIGENTEEYFEDFTIDLTQLLNDENIEEYFEDHTFAFTQHLDDKYFAEKLQFVEN